MAKRVLPVYIEDDQRQSLQVLARREQVSMAELVRQAICTRLEQGAAGVTQGATYGPANDVEGLPSQTPANDNTSPLPAAQRAPAAPSSAGAASAAKAAEPEVPW